MAKAWVYILYCSDGTYYVGSTNDVTRRIKEHQTGYGCKYTNVRQPVLLMFTEEYASVRAARAAERQIKGWSRKKKEALILGDRDTLHQLSQCRNISHFSMKMKQKTV